MRKPIITAALAFAAFASAAPAAAETFSVRVAYADLDLADPAGAATLGKRLDAAVEKVCLRPDIRDLKAMAAWQKCKVAARTDAFGQLAALSPAAGPELASRF